MHIRIYRIAACGPVKGLPPTQTRAIPGSQGKTPVAQMHFASELPLSQWQPQCQWPNDEPPSKCRLNLEKMGKLLVLPDWMICYGLAECTSLLPKVLFFAISAFMSWTKLVFWQGISGFEPPQTSP